MSGCNPPRIRGVFTDYVKPATLDDSRALESHGIGSDSERKMQGLSETEQATLNTRQLTDSFVADTLRQVDRILASKLFEHVQNRSRDCLRFIVAKHLLGCSEIKEITIAMAIWKEGTTFDTSEFNKVRVCIIDLRKRLTQYYASIGQNDPIHIAIPLGIYVPEIVDRRPAVGVILFANWNVVGDQNHLCATVSDEITDRLMRDGGLRATRLTSDSPNGKVFNYFLRGSLECPQDSLHLNVSLADQANRQVVFCRAFEGRRDDLLTLCRQIAQTVVMAIRPGESVSHSCQTPPEPFQALQPYQQGRLHLRRRTPTDIGKSIELFEAAIKANPGYARAYSGLADCHMLLSWYEMSTPDRLWFDTAQRYALLGRDLDPSLPEVRTSLAYATLLAEFDWARAEAEFQQAIRIDNRYPQAHHWYSNLLVMQGRFEEAEEEIKRAFYLDPGCIVIRKTLGDPHYYAGRYPQAIDCYRATLEINPDFWMAHIFLAWAYEQAGDLARAEQEFNAVASQGCIGSILQGALGHLYALSGRQDDARRILHCLQQRANVAPHTMAVIYAALGDKHHAFEWLDACYHQRIEIVGWIKVDPRFASLRQDPRFHAFLERLGLVPPVPPNLLPARQD